MNSGVYFALMSFFNMCSSSRLELSKLWEDILEGKTSVVAGLLYWRRSYTQAFHKLGKAAGSSQKAEKSPPVGAGGLGGYWTV